MSLPWKKPKSSRFSRFISELQKSPKRGGSLVVETGFPTSLIDLFFKNRDRLKKSNSKRVQKTQTASLEKPMAVKTVRSKIEKVNFVDGGLTAENDKTVYGGGRNGVCVLMVLMVFIVMVVALSTKKNLTLGITLSTFALLLTELVVARLFTRLKLCNTETKKEKPVVTIHDKNVISCKKIETFVDSREEIQVPKSLTKSKETEPIREKSNSKGLTIRDLLLKDEKSKSKSSRLKSKIVKKLRSYKKKKEKIMIKEESLTEVSSFVSEDKSEMIESERDTKESNPKLIGSKGDNMNGVVVIVIVLTGLLSGKILAIGLTLSCLFLRFKAAKKSGLCK